MGEDRRRPRIRLTAGAALALYSLLLTLLTLIFSTGEAGLPAATRFLLRPLALGLNALVPVLWALLCYFAFGRAWLAALLTAVPALLIALVNYYKLLLRGDPLLFEDITLMAEAGAMSKRYAFPFSFWVLAAALLALAGVIGLGKHWQNRALPRARTRILGAACCVAALAASALWLYPSGALYARTGISGVWAPTQSYTDHGVLYPFLHSVSALQSAAPEGYDEQEVQAELAALPDTPLTEAQKPHIIAIMLEAFGDFEGQLDFTRSPYADWDALAGFSGRLVTSIFAGGTVDTERCFLTGCLSVPSPRRDTDSYVRYFRSQGYTASGNHPWYDWFYNRVNVNPYLGFERYAFLEERFAGHTDDQTLTDAIYADYRANLATGKPLLSFSVSYQNHGPYDTQPAYDTPWLAWREGYDADGYAIANNYFEGVADTCAQLRRLAERLENESEPVVLIAFGDHKPWLGDKNSVYEMLGFTLDTSTEKGFHHYYDTPYLIWFNAAARESLNPAGECGTISPCFLWATYLRLIGAPGDAYNQRLTALMADTSYVNCVAYESDGRMKPRAEGESDAVRALTALSHYRLTRWVE